MKLTSIFTWALVLSNLMACTGQVGGPPTTQAPPPPAPDPKKPDPDPPPPDPLVVIPLELPGQATSSTCTARRPGESVLAVSPEGHLWLATSSGATSLRVLDGWDAGHVGAYELPIARVQAAQVWTATTAVLVGDGRLFRLADGERVEVSLPGSIGAEVSICGAFEDRALLLSDGELYERIEDEWWTWTGLEGLGPTARLLDRDGECAGPGDGVWLSRGGLELWRLTPTELSNPALLEGGTSPAQSGDRVFALKDGHLFIGPEPWAERAFAHGGARLMAAAGAFVWVVAGEALLRFDGTEWVTITGVDARDFTVLHPHASGGVWAERGDEICHSAPTPMLRIRGARHGEQHAEAGIALEAQATVADMLLSAEVDGQALSPTRVASGWFSFERAVEVGWHRISITSPDGRGLRVLDVKVLPSVTRSFATDVLPIYQRHCGDARCHVAASASAAPNLSRYQDWIDRPERINARIVITKDMPPTAARQPDWGADEVAIINEWLNGGMRP